MFFRGASECCWTYRATPACRRGAFGQRLDQLRDLPALGIELATSRVLGNFKVRVLVAWARPELTALQLLGRISENVIVTQTRVRIPSGRRRSFLHEG